MNNEFYDHYGFDTQSEEALENEEFNHHKNEVFLYLEELRASGKTNMFGAHIYVMGDFEISKSLAIKLVSAWMKSYQKEYDEEE